MSKFHSQKAVRAPSYEQAVEKALVLKNKYGDELVDIVTSQYKERLDPLGYHGIPHWERVLINGLMLKQMLPDYVCEDTIFLFALFHDSKRVNEGHDILHGMRGADYFKQCFDSGFIDPTLLGSESKSLSIISSVVKACSYHTLNLFDGNSKVAACYDADRLDLERVGIYPDVTKLNYQTAISKDLIYECSMRARQLLSTPIFRSEHEARKRHIAYAS